MNIGAAIGIIGVCGAAAALMIFGNGGADTGIVATFILIGGLISVGYKC